MRTTFFLLIILLFCQIAEAQITISSINLKGNLKTKDHIILRELAFKQGVNYSNNNLNEKIQESKENLINLQLFNFIDIENIKQNDSAQIIITVVERWYILPYPIFEVSDRNFNSWWKEFSTNNYSDFSRINYGVFINWENFRGRNEILNLKFRKGFKEHYLLSYEVPYFNKNKTIGTTTNLQLFRRKKTHYATKDNKLKYFEDSNFSSIDYDLNHEIVYRKNIHQKHKLKFAYLQSNISDSIVITNRNPNYLGNAQTSAQLFSISYEFENEKRDYIIYPLNGHAFNLEFKKYLSPSIKHIEFISKSEKHIEPLHRFYVGSSFKTKYSTPGNQPYFMQKGLGYEDYVRGYEYYVIDGQSYWLSKTAAKYCIIKNKYFEIPYIKMQQFKKSHYSLYFSVFSDAGYILDDQNNSPLNNVVLWGKGISLDYVTYYDKLLRIEYSINRLGEKGLFLHFSNPF